MGVKMTSKYANPYRPRSYEFCNFSQLFPFVPNRSELFPIVPNRSQSFRIVPNCSVSFHNVVLAESYGLRTTDRWVPCRQTSVLVPKAFLRVSGNKADGYVEWYGCVRHFFLAYCKGLNIRQLVSKMADTIAEWASNRSKLFKNHVAYKTRKSGRSRMDCFYLLFVSFMD